MHGILVLLHVLGACVWVGGHLVLALSILPRVLRDRSVADLLWFESAYERVGLPALLVQVVTGVLLAHALLPDVSQWLDFADPLGRLVGLKLLLLATTALLALDARLRIIPRLAPERLRALAWHVVPVTLISVLFVVVGVAFRTGWLA